MSIKKAVEILKKHNEWRRYDGPTTEGPKMQHPENIGIAIDAVIKYFEGQDG